MLKMNKQMPCLSLHKAIVLLDGLCKVISILIKWNAAVQVIVAFITSICSSPFFLANCTSGQSPVKLKP